MYQSLASGTKQAQRASNESGETLENYSDCLNAGKLQSRRLRRVRNLSAACPHTALTVHMSPL